ncbi:glycoside hydrolase [Acephala macrosclerotiorum]|nr:glycoside hydrolase [Acephala macrosclerotiorum]
MIFSDTATNLGSIFVLERWLCGIIQDDLNWLVNTAHWNMIRLPIGWFTLGPSWCGAAVRNIVQRCHDAGIGVLIDIHALPGGANSDIHSGTSSGTAAFIADEANTMPGVVSLQFCNEAETGAAGKGMFDWYGSTTWQINQVNKNLPVHAFSDFDKSQSPWQIVTMIPNELNELNGQEGDVFNGGAACLLVGEYSCVLDPMIWSKTRPDQVNALRQQFGTVQRQRWQSKFGGCSFWTFKMVWMDGGDWGFKQQTNDGNITAPASITLATGDVNNRASNANGAAQGLHGTALNAHNGWTDAQTFFTARANRLVPGGNGGDKIGFLDLWVRKRMLETQNEQISTGFGWEWEQGFRKGLADYYGAVGI